MSNKKKKTKDEVSVYFLASDKSLSPSKKSYFIDALKNYTISWFSDPQKLLKQKPKKYQTIVIDLEILIKQSKLEDIDNFFSAPLSASFLTLTHIKATFADANIIILTEEKKNLIVHCFRLGVFDVLIKPCTEEEIKWSVFRSFQKQKTTELLKKFTLDQNKYFNSKNNINILFDWIGKISNSFSSDFTKLITLKLIQDLTKASKTVWFEFTQKGDLASNIMAWPNDLAISQRDKIAKELKELSSTSKILKITSLSDKWKAIPMATHTHKAFVLFKSPMKEDKQLYALLLAMIQNVESSLSQLYRFNELEERTYRDDLTQLFNNRYLKIALNHILLTHKKSKKEFSILFIDADYFKKINDTFGHPVGSQLIRALGKSISSKVRSKDLAFRYGGDEFVVILENTNLKKALDIGERIRKGIEERKFQIKGHAIDITVSIGVATYPLDATNPESLLSLADKALYGAKQSKRNMVLPFCDMYKMEMEHEMISLKKKEGYKR